MLILNLPSASFFQSALLHSTLSQFRDGYVTVTLNRAGATVRQVAELVLIRLELAGNTLIDFNLQAGFNLLSELQSEIFLSAELDFQFISVTEM